MDKNQAYEILKKDSLSLPIFTDKAFKNALLLFYKAKTTNPVWNIEVRYGSLLISFFDAFKYIQSSVHISDCLNEGVTAYFKLQSPGKLKLKTASPYYVSYFRDLIFEMKQTSFPIDSPLNGKLSPEKVVYQLLADVNRPVITKEVEDELETVFTTLSDDLGFSKEDTAIKSEIYFPTRKPEDFKPFMFEQLPLFEDENSPTTSKPNQKIFLPQ